MRKNLSLFLLLAASALMAQKQDLTEQYIQKYPDDQAVYLNRS